MLEKNKKQHRQSPGILRQKGPPDLSSGPRVSPTSGVRRISFEVEPDLTLTVRLWPKAAGGSQRSREQPGRNTQRHLQVTRPQRGRGCRPRCPSHRNSTSSLTTGSATCRPRAREQGRVTDGAGHVKPAGRGFDDPALSSGTAWAVTLWPRGIPSETLATLPSPQKGNRAAASTSGFYEQVRSAPRNNTATRRNAVQLPPPRARWPGNAAALPVTFTPLHQGPVSARTCPRPRGVAGSAATCPRLDDVQGTSPCHTLLLRRVWHSKVVLNSSAANREPPLPVRESGPDDAPCQDSAVRFQNRRVL